MRVFDARARIRVVIIGLVGVVLIIFISWARGNMGEILDTVMNWKVLKVNLGRVERGKYDPEESMYMRAKVYYINDAYRKAKELFLEVVEKYPESEYAPKALSEIAQIYSGKGQFQEVLKWNQRVISEYPESDMVQKARLSTAEIHKEHLKNYQVAVEQYEELISSYPEEDLPISVQADLGDCYVQLNDSEKAIGAYQKAIQRYQKQIDNLKTGNGNLKSDIRKKIEKLNSKIITLR